MIYMVSYQLLNGFCGNQCFDDIDEVRPYINTNKSRWISYAVFQYTPHPSGISTLLLSDSLIRHPE